MLLVLLFFILLQIRAELPAESAKIASCRKANSAGRF